MLLFCIVKCRSIIKLCTKIFDVNMGRFLAFFVGAYSCAEDKVELLEVKLL
jgi:hypothetical protein